MERSFGSHKSPKTRENNGTFFFNNGKERNVPNGKECKSSPLIGEYISHKWLHWFVILAKIYILD